MNGRGKKLSKPKIQNKINNNRNPFILKKKKDKLKIELLEMLGQFLNNKEKIIINIKE